MPIIGYIGIVAALYIRKICENVHKLGKVPVNSDLLNKIKRCLRSDNFNHFIQQGGITSGLDLTLSSNNERAANSCCFSIFRDINILNTFSSWANSKFSFEKTEHKCQPNKLQMMLLQEADLSLRCICCGKAFPFSNV